MTRSQAKKIAYRRAYKILQSTLSAGWDPNEIGSYSYTDVDSRKILTGMNEIMMRLFYLSDGNLEDAGAVLEDSDLEPGEGWTDDLSDYPPDHREDTITCGCSKCREIWLQPKK